jgi:hypothetical protein
MKNVANRFFIISGISHGLRIVHLETFEEKEKD